MLALAAVLAPAWGAGFAQADAISYWGLPKKTVADMLLPSAESEDQRFQKLRQYFAELHCGPEQMQVTVVNKHNDKNILCVLPGKDAEQIVVGARYEPKEKVDGVKQGWDEAVMLPILYNALRSQPREHTFVFAALCGHDGEKAFLDSIKKNQRPMPKVMVPLDRLGFGAPRFFDKPPEGAHKAVADLYELLNSDAVYTLKLQHLFNTSAALLQGWTDEMLKDWSDRGPTILITSDFQGIIEPDPQGLYKMDNASHPLQHVSVEGFERDFDFVAYLICKIDLSLATEAGQHAREPGGPAAASGGT
jgi:hypothetical protein